MIPTLKEWTDGTSVFGRFRSEELKIVDRAIAAYQADRNDAMRGAVGAAWAHWKYRNARDIASLSANRRNSKNLFSLLDAEFSDAGTARPTTGAISRWQMRWPESRPIGFSQVDETTSRNRIDKAIVDAQSVLQIVIARLRKGDSDTLAQCATWFGATPLDTIRSNFNKLGEKALNGFKSTSTLEIRWTSKAGETAATGFSQEWMSFGASFFDDEKVFTGINLAGRPAAPPGHISELRGIADSFEGPKKIRIMLERVANWTALEGATLGDCAGKAFKANADSYSTLRAFMGDALTSGYTMSMPKADAVRKLARDQADNASDIAKLNGRYLEITKLKTTASGVIIHELTHMVLGTKDHPSPLSTSMTCYGAALCMHLASVNPAAASTNADNYRLFAECCQM